MLTIDDEARLNKILDSWENRAQVRQNTLLPDTLFDLSKKDFLPEWLPFFNHPIFKQQAHLTNQVLSLAWLIYNQVTIDIENEVVIPLCLSLQTRLDDEDIFNTLMVQTMIDESYHVLLTAHACTVTRKQRHLENISLPKSGFVKAMQQCQNLYQEAWQKDLILLATGVVTEVFIGSYLSLIANCKDDSLQPLNKLVTKVHFIDESTHGFIFSTLAYKLIPSLPKQEKDFFEKIFPQAILWFFEHKTTSWSSVLQQIGFKEEEKMLKDCYKNPITILKEEHWDKIQSLVKNLGYKNFTENLLRNF